LLRKVLQEVNGAVLFLSKQGTYISKHSVLSSRL